MLPPSSPLAAVPRVVAPGQVRRVLLVKLSSLGDVVHALPLADALRAGLGPSVFLGWAVRDKFADLLRGNPNLDAVYQLTGTRAGDLAAFGKTLRGEPFDAALDAQGLLVSGVVTRLSGAPVRIGLDKNREGNRFFLTHPVVLSRQRTHMVDKLMGFCDALGIPRRPPTVQSYLAQAEAPKARELLTPLGNTPCAGFIVGASTPDKTWPWESWAEAAKLLRAQGVRVVLLGGPGERETARAILEKTGDAAVCDLTGQTPLRVLSSVLAQCSVVVGGDSGPLHLAVAVGVPVVGLYGVTDPVRTGPCWGAGEATVLDDAENDAPPALRRPRHSVLTDALSRIPARAVAQAALARIAGGGVGNAGENRL